MNTTYHGAAVLIALLPILPLAMYLRRRGRGQHPRGAVAASTVSAVLLMAGVGIAIGSGAF